MEELDIDYGGDTIEIGFNVTYLMDALANMGQDMVTIDLQDGNSSALMTIPDNEQLQVRGDADAHLTRPRGGPESARTSHRPARSGATESAEPAPVRVLPRRPHRAT